MPKPVCFVTLSRSDYTSLRPVIRAAREDAEIQVRLVAGGSHLLRRFGSSIDDIRADGFDIDEVIDFLREADDSALDIARAFARASEAFVEYFNRHRPRYVFILGDRWEMLAVAQAASLLAIPIVHHSGGDITQGSADNQTRYLLSMLSHLHLVALEQHRQRLLCMGEEPWRVSWVGEPALTEIGADPAIDLYARLGLKPGTAFVLATYHPTSYEILSVDEQASAFVGLLDLIQDDIVLTAPNPDPGSATFLRKLQEYAGARANVHLFENLGADFYHAAMDRARFMIGNSSSGIWEAPSFGLPVINIGNRQQDRLRGENVIDVGFDTPAVERAIGEVDDLRARDSLRQRINPYVRAETLTLILDAIKQDIAEDRLLAKVFVDPLTGR